MPQLFRSRIKNVSTMVALSLSALTFVIQPSTAANKPANFETETKAYNLCSEGNSLVAQADYDKAIDVLQSAAKLDPTSYSPHVHLALAKCYRGQKSYEKAVAEAKASMKYDASNESPVYLLAQIYTEMNRPDESLKYLKQFVAMTKDPEMKKTAQQYIQKASVFTNLTSARKSIDAGKDRDALKLLDAAAEADPSPYSAAIHASKSFVHRRLGESEKAIDEGKQALEFDPQDKGTAYNIAIAYQDIAKFDDAISWLKRYAKMESDPAARAAAETFMHELETDRTQFNADDNKKSDYLEEMKSSKDVPGWPKERLPLKVYIAPGTGVKGFQPVFRSFATKSLDTWCVSSGKKINYVLVKDPAQADVTISWTKDELVGSDASDKRLRAGLTTLDSAGLEIRKALVRIRTVNPFDPSSPVSKGECAFVVLHEIGHAFGLGHSKSIYDVMYFRSSTKQSGTPTKRDNATIARLYSELPPVAFVAKAESAAAGPVTYLPPPVFTPPKLTDVKKILPPLFVPPPLASEKKLEPPLYTPPPIAPSVKQETPPSATPAKVPLFVPPPIDKKKTPPKSKPPGPQLFVPPPLKRN